ncbi:MAG: HU family DNA-binding protein [Acidobacteriota bacterium]
MLSQRSLEPTHFPTTHNGGTMNKGDLINRIAGDASISKAQAGAALDSLIDGITSTLKKGGRVTLVGFGTFSTSQRKARTGRNPQTGAPLKIPARRVAKFSPGADLKGAAKKAK